MFNLIDAQKEEDVRAFFDALEREHPSIIAAMKLMNISYQQYLAALQTMESGTTVSTASGRISL